MRGDSLRGKTYTIRAWQLGLHMVRVHVYGTDVLPHDGHFLVCRKNVLTRTRNNSSPEQKRGTFWDNKISEHSMISDDICMARAFVPRIPARKMQY